MKLRKQNGFTLIELVIVIVIIGILAAIALPKFLNAQTDARVAKMNALYGSIRTAAALAKAGCELDLARTPVGTCTAAAGTLNMDGTNVNMINKYPAATALGIQAAASIVSSSDGVTIVAGPPFLIQATGVTTPANCQISYTAAAAGGAPAITPTISTAGCT